MDSEGFGIVAPGGFREGRGICLTGKNPVTLCLTGRNPALQAGKLPFRQESCLSGKIAALRAASINNLILTSAPAAPSSATEEGRENTPPSSCRGQNSPPPRYPSGRQNATPHYPTGYPTYHIGYRRLKKLVARLGYRKWAIPCPLLLHLGGKELPTFDIRGWQLFFNLRYPT